MARQTRWIMVFFTILLGSSIAAVANLLASLNDRRSVDLHFQSIQHSEDSHSLRSLHNSMHAAIREHAFDCYDPTARVKQAAAEFVIEQPRSKREMNEAKNSLLLKGRLASIIGQCDTYRPTPTSAARYIVCHGKDIQVESTRAATHTSSYELGSYLSGRETRGSKGSVTQLYGNITTGEVTAEVHFICGTEAGPSRIFDMLDPSEQTEGGAVVHRYRIFRVYGGAFCDWKLHPGNRENQELPLELLLRQFEGSCISYEEQFFTYELCYPTRLTQVHSVSNGSSRGRTEYNLGILPSPVAVAARQRQAKLPRSLLGQEPPHYEGKAPLVSFASSSAAGAQTSPSTVVPESHRFPMDFDAAPEVLNGDTGTGTATYHPATSILEQDDSLAALLLEAERSPGVREQTTLKLHLTGGSKCGKVDRQSHVYFQCPENFASLPLSFQQPAPPPAISMVAEPSVCEYAIKVVTVLACAHPALLPPAKLIVKPIRCFKNEYAAPGPGALRSEAVASKTFDTCSAKTLNEKDGASAERCSAPPLVEQEFGASTVAEAADVDNHIPHTHPQSETSSRMSADAVGGPDQPSHALSGVSENESDLMSPQVHP